MLQRHRGVGVFQQLSDGGDLLRQFAGPGLALRRGGARRCGVVAGVGVGVEFGLLAAGVWGLEVRAQPADMALLFFAGAFGIQRRQAGKQGFFGFGQRIGFVHQGGERAGLAQQGASQVLPAVGFQHGGVQFVVQFVQHGRQAVGVQGFFLGVQRGVAALFFQHVIQAGEGDVGVSGLLFFAVGVDFFRQRADSAGLGVGERRERKGFKAAGFVVARTIFQSAACRQRPQCVDAAGEHAQGGGLIVGNHHQHIVWGNFGIHELEDAMLGRFYCGDKAR